MRGHLSICRALSLCALWSLSLSGCGGAIEDVTDSVGTNTAALSTTSSDPILVGAGDISVCGGTGDDQTANLLDRLFANNPNGTIFTAGDNSNESGTASQFTSCFQPSWGRHKANIDPTPGNHDYTLSGASAYYNYFGTSAGTRGYGYYSYDVGAWHIVALNSNCGSVGGCGVGSAQERWLRSDLAAHPAACTLAYWHHPRFSSGGHGNTTEVQPLWQALYEYGAEVVVNGHDHDYERFAPQTPTGGLDTATGIREFVSGTGGAGQRPFATARPNSELRHTGTFGVLQFTLHATSYDWKFVSASGDAFSDSGTANCH